MRNYEQLRGAKSKLDRLGICAVITEFEHGTKSKTEEKGVTRFRFDIRMLEVNKKLHVRNGSVSIILFDFSIQQNPSL